MRCEVHSYRLGVNHLADLTNEEFRKIYSQPFKRTRPERTTWLNITAANSVDWRQQNAVTPVKNQGQCGNHENSFQSHDFVFDAEDRVGLSVPLGRQKEPLRLQVEISCL